MNLILTGTVASLLAALGTGIGGLVIFAIPRISDRLLDTALGFAAGVMLAATSFCLLIPALETGGIGPAVIGMALGSITFVFAERFTPHIHHIVAFKDPVHYPSRLWLFVLAVAIHNFPEGVAVGVSFGRGETGTGVAVATGIWLQNIPEGLAVAAAVLRAQATKRKAFWVAFLTGLVEPIGGILGISTVSLTECILLYGLAFAVGAMLFVISSEVIPETHLRGNGRQASAGVVAGFLVMLVLDNALS